MKDRELDKIFKEKLENRHFGMREEDWLKMEARLPKPRPFYKNWRYLLPALLLITSLSGYWGYNYVRTSSNQSGALVNSIQENKFNTTASQSEISTKEIIANTTHQSNENTNDYTQDNKHTVSSISEDQKDIRKNKATGKEPQVFTHNQNSKNQSKSKVGGLNNSLDGSSEAVKLSTSKSKEGNELAYGEGQRKFQHSQKNKGTNGESIAASEKQNSEEREQALAETVSPSGSDKDVNLKSAVSINKKSLESPIDALMEKEKKEEVLALDETLEELQTNMMTESSEAEKKETIEKKETTVASGFSGKGHEIAKESENSLWDENREEKLETIKKEEGESLSSNLIDLISFDEETPQVWAFKDFIPVPSEDDEDDIEVTPPPGKEDFNKDHLEVGLNFITSASLKREITPTEAFKSLATERAKGEKTLLSYGVGADVRYSRSDVLFESGLRYEKIREKLEYAPKHVLKDSLVGDPQTLYTIDNSYWEVDSILIHPEKGDSVWFESYYEYDSTEIVKIDSFYTQFFKTEVDRFEKYPVKEVDYSVVTIPISAGYRWTMNKMDLDLTGGVLFSVVSGSTLEYLTFENNENAMTGYIREVDRSNFASMITSLRLGFAADYRIRKSWAVRLSGEYTHQLQSLFKESYGIDQKNHWMKMHLGVIYRFNPIGKKSE